MRTYAPMQPSESNHLEIPYSQSSHLYVRYFQWLVNVTRRYPNFSKYSFISLSAISIPATALVWTLPLMGVAVSAAIAWPVTVALVGVGLFALTCSFLQNYFFGFNLPVEVTAYKTTETIRHENAPSATAKITAEQVSFPGVEITADNHHDAGFIEGYALAPQLAECYTTMMRFFWIISKLIGAPQDDEKIIEYLQPLLHNIPTEYITEMKAKIKGYNTWQQQNPAAPKIQFGRYALIQLLPDFHQFNPFKQTLLPTPTFGCTSISVRAGKWTAYVRNLDWPSYGLGEYMLTIKRDIKNHTTTTDISMPILTGALTILNQNNLLVQMNVGRGDALTKLTDEVPAVFLNRMVAERYEQVPDDKTLTNIRSIASYHLSICDGKDVASVHTKQHPTLKHDHLITRLAQEDKQPIMMAVSNHGLRWSQDQTSGQDKAQRVNHHDSLERDKNIESCFEHQVRNGGYARFFSTESSPEYDADALEENMLTLARLPLVSNYHTVLSAVYLYHEGQLVRAKAATDNHHAAERETPEFRPLQL